MANYTLNEVDPRQLGQIKGRFEQAPGLMTRLVEAVKVRILDGDPSFTKRNKQDNQRGKQHYITIASPELNNSHFPNT